MRSRKCLRQGRKRGGHLETNHCSQADLALELIAESVGRKEEEDWMEVLVVGLVGVEMGDPKVDHGNRLLA